MAQGERTLIVPPDAPMRPKREFRDRDDRGPRDRNDRGPRGDREDRPRRERRDVGDMQLYRIEVGRDDGVEVRHIVGAIANEGDISSRYIGNIKLFASHSTIELPKGMPGEVLQHFTRTRILNKPMNMQLLGDAQPHTGGERRGGGRGFGGERREGGRNFSGERRCTVLKWAAMMVLKFVISLVRLLTKATSAAVTSVTSSCLLLTPPSNCRKVCRVKCCNTLRVLEFSTSR